MLSRMSSLSSATSSKLCQDPVACVGATSAIQDVCMPDMFEDFNGFMMRERYLVIRFVNAQQNELIVKRSLK